MKAELSVGPGQYQPKMLNHSRSANFDNSKSQRYIDLVMKKSLETPAPGSHMKANTPQEMKSLNDLNRYFGCRPTST
jgi:hypothetical protein